MSLRTRFYTKPNSLTNCSKRKHSAYQWRIQKFEIKGGGGKVGGEAWSGGYGPSSENFWKFYAK